MSSNGCVRAWFGRSTASARCASPGGAGVPRADRLVADTSAYQWGLQVLGPSVNEVLSTKGKSLGKEVVEALLEATSKLRGLKIGDDDLHGLPYTAADLVSQAVDGLKALNLAEPGQEDGATITADRERVVGALTEALAMVTLANDSAESQQREHEVEEEEQEEQKEEHQHQHQQYQGEDGLSLEQENEIARREVISNSAVAAARAQLAEVEQQWGAAKEHVAVAEAHLKAALDVAEDWCVDDGGDDFCGWFAATVEDKTVEILDTHTGEAAACVSSRRTDPTGHQMLGWDSRQHPASMRPTLGGLSLPRLG